MYNIAIPCINILHAYDVIIKLFSDYNNLHTGKEFKYRESVHRKEEFLVLHRMKRYKRGRSLWEVCIKEVRSCYGINIRF